jgi:predicted ATP-dependent endonuclease of OLD family
MVVKGKEKGSLVLDRLTHPALMGDELTDALSPIISNIGLDIRQSLTFARDYSLIVEGITDHIYISALARQFQPALLDDIGIFPSTGAGAVPVFASLFIGWGLRFAVLLDRDSKGEEVKNKLVYEMGLDARSVIQPNGMEAIEDVFSAEDFRNLVRELDPAYLINPGESNTAAIKRLRIDKVLLARKYAELAATNAVALTERTTQKARRLLSDIETAVHRV